MKFFTTVFLACAGLALATAGVQNLSPSAPSGGSVNYAQTFNYFKSLPSQSIAKLPKFAPALQELTPEIIEFLKTLDEDQYNLVIDSYIDLAYLTPQALKFLKTVPEETFAKIFEFLPVVPEYLAEIQTFLRQYSEEEIQQFLQALPKFEQLTAGDFAAFKAKTDEELKAIIKENFPKLTFFTPNFIEFIRYAPLEQFENIIEAAPTLVSVVPELVSFFKYTPSSEFQKFSYFKQYEPKQIAADFVKFLNFAGEELVENLYKITPKLFKYRSEIYNFVKAVPASFIDTFVQVAPKFAKLTPEKIAELQSDPQAYAEFFKGY